VNNNQQYDNMGYPVEIVSKTRTNALLGKSFLFMLIGLLLTGVVALFTAYSGAVITILSNPLYFYGMMIVQLGVVWTLSLAFKKLSYHAAGALFFVYAILSGVTLSIIFLAYELYSIIYIFFAAAAMFGALAVVGYKTKKDLIGWRPVIQVGLIVSIIVSLINIFILHLSMLDVLLDVVILGLFCAATIYDINKIKKAQRYANIPQDKLAVYFALDLYLDFINIFLRLLSLLGKRR
jgi:FtsH-binding integral membrane protein